MEPIKSGVSIQEAYDSEPWWYDLRGLMILTLSYRTTLWDQLSFFSKNLRHRHLEAAVGSGSLFALIWPLARLQGKRPQKVWAFDYAEPMLVGARARFKQKKEFVVFAADAAHLSLPSQSVDSINLANAFHCISDIAGALKEFHRVLVPGGTLATNVLLVPRGPAFLRRISERINEWGMKKGILFSPYQENQGLMLLQSAGFEILEQRVRGNSLNILAQKKNS